MEPAPAACIRRPRPSRRRQKCHPPHAEAHDEHRPPTSSIAGRAEAAHELDRPAVWSGAAEPRGSSAPHGEERQARRDAEGGMGEERGFRSAVCATVTPYDGDDNAKRADLGANISRGWLRVQQSSGISLRTSSARAEPAAAAREPRPPGVRPPLHAFLATLVGSWEAALAPGSNLARWPMNPRSRGRFARCSANASCVTIHRDHAGKAATRRRPSRSTRSQALSCRGWTTST
jgi:hypothetical protein